MTSFTTIATHLINTLGLGGVFVGLTINCIGIPIPSEIIIPLTGIAIKQGTYNLIAAMAVMIVAQLIGLVIEYAIGRYGGVELIQRYGKYVFLSRHELDRAQVQFERYGSRLVLFGLILPGIHGYVGYPAGIARMSLWRFVMTALVGVVAWTVAFVLVGYFLGGHLEAIDAVLHKFAIVIILLLIVAAIWYIRRRKRNPHIEDPAKHTA